MEKKLLNALEEMEGAKFESLDQALQNSSGREIFNFWLEYEGIIGYGESILEAVDALELWAAPKCMAKPYGCMAKPYGCMAEPYGYVKEAKNYKAHLAGMTPEEIRADLLEKLKGK